VGNGKGMEGGERDVKAKGGIKGKTESRKESGLFFFYFIFFGSLSREEKRKEERGKRKEEIGKRK